MTPDAVRIKDSTPVDYCWLPMAFVLGVSLWSKVAPTDQWCLLKMWWGATAAKLVVSPFGGRRGCNDILHCRTHHSRPMPTPLQAALWTSDVQARRCWDSWPARTSPSKEQEREECCQARSVLNWTLWSLLVSLYNRRSTRIKSLGFSDLRGYTSVSTDIS